MENPITNNINITAQELIKDFQDRTLWFLMLYDSLKKILNTRKVIATPIITIPASIGVFSMKKYKYCSTFFTIN